MRANRIGCWLIIQLMLGFDRSRSSTRDLSIAVTLSMDRKKSALLFLVNLRQDWLY